MVTLPFTHRTFEPPKPVNNAYPMEIKAFGYQIYKRRLDLGKCQKDVTPMVSATTSMQTNREKSQSSPRLYLLPKIIKFLGFDPLKGNATSLRRENQTI
jgi:hypothetical protein